MVLFANFLNLSIAQSMMAILKENQDLYLWYIWWIIFFIHSNALWCMTFCTAKTRKLKTTFLES